MSDSNESNPYKLAYEREKTARVTAEKLLDEKTREIYSNQQHIEAQYKQLKQSHEKLIEAKEQLVQAEKLATVGQLAAGVAHEINNPIGFISSNLQTLNEYLIGFNKIFEQSDNSQLKDDYIDGQDILTECREGIERVKQIVESLKNYSRESKSVTEPCSAHELVVEAIKMAKSQDLQERIHATLETDIMVQANKTEIIQVLLNILINGLQAIDSMDDLSQEERNKKQIIAKLSDIDDFVQITISDNGPGIPESTLKNIFDPFFTTKEVGKGTGLGLSVSKEIVERHQGKLNVKSITGKGTIFSICLPKAN